MDLEKAKISKSDPEPKPYVFRVRQLGEASWTVEWKKWWDFEPITSWPTEAMARQAERFYREAFRDG